MVAAVVAVVVILGQRIRLIADGPVELSDQTRVGPDAPVVGLLREGDDVPVLRCVDTKHYILPEVQMSEGTRGYVVGPRFHLRRGAIWSDLESPVVFSC